MHKSYDSAPQGRIHIDRLLGVVRIQSMVGVGVPYDCSQIFITLATGVALIKKAT